jgi:hypothetical protein
MAKKMYMINISVEGLEQEGGSSQDGDNDDDDTNGSGEDGDDGYNDDEDGDLLDDLPDGMDIDKEVRGRFQTPSAKTPAQGGGAKIMVNHVQTPEQIAHLYDGVLGLESRGQTLEGWQENAIIE